MAHRLTRRHRLAATLVGLACAVSACNWPWLDDMARQPSRPADAGPRTPATGTVPIGESLPLSLDVAGRQLQNPVPRSAPTDRGRRLYSVYCAPCHGVAGRGDGPVAGYFAPPMGDLASHEVQGHGDGWFYAVITRGTDVMPRFAYELDAAERWHIVHFVRSFGGEGR